MVHIKGTKSNKKQDNQLLLIALFVFSMSTFRLGKVFQSVAALFNFSSIAITIASFVFTIGKMTSYSTIRLPFLINNITN